MVDRVLTEGEKEELLLEEDNLLGGGSMNLIEPRKEDLRRGIAEEMDETKVCEEELLEEEEEGVELTNKKGEERASLQANQSTRKKKAMLI